MSKFENLKLRNQLCFALYSATNAITRNYQTKLNDVGLTYPQYLVMMVLWEKDRIPVKSLASALKLDPATISPILKRLEKNGMLTRQHSDLDERIVNVGLTDLGRDIQAKVAEIQKSVACQTNLSEIEFIELRNTLHQLADSLSINPLDFQDVA